MHPRRQHLHRACIIALLLPLVAPGGSRAGSSLKPAKKRLAKSIVQWSLIPKVHIGTKGVFSVYPDGRPTDARQGRVKLGQSTVGRRAQACMERGRAYRPQRGYVDINVDDRSIQVGLYYCSWFKIHYGRHVTAADLEPSAVARALSGFFEISGPGVEGGIESVLERALLPIELGNRRASFQGTAFSNPAGWEPELSDREIYYRQGRDRDIRVRSRELEPAEIRAGGTIMLQEELPRRLLESARQRDPGARVETLARAYEQAGFGMGWADVVYDGTYERHHWIFDEEGGRLYTLRAKGRPDDRRLFAGAMTEVVESVGPVASESALNAGLGGGLAGSDLPAPTDFRRPGPGGAPSLLDFRTAATPPQVRPGDTVELELSFEIGGSAGVEIAVRESRTLLFNDHVLPNYPVVEESRLVPGRYETVLPETIPELADTGRYELRSELCVGEDCQIRTAAFEVVR